MHNLALIKLSASGSLSPRLWLNWRTRSGEDVGGLQFGITSAGFAPKMNEDIISGEKSVSKSSIARVGLVSAYACRITKVALRQPPDVTRRAQPVALLSFLFPHIPLQLIRRSGSSGVGLFNPKCLDCAVVIE